MSKTKRVKNRKPLTEQINCFNCNNCDYIGEGDHICLVTEDCVICDWEPTDDFYQCEGKEFEYVR